MPTYEEVAALLNSRVGMLDKFRARQVVVRLQYTDQDGNAQQEQVDGSLRFKRPTDVYLLLHKAGAKDVAVLGANSEKYWWLTLVDAKQALVGEHARFAVDHVDRFSMPVHPLDLLDLLAITPVPSAAARDQSIRFDDQQGLLVMSAPSRFGYREILLIPSTYQPTGVVIYDSMGAEVAQSVLSKLEAVNIPGVAKEHEPKVAGHVDITFGNSDTRAVLTMRNLTTAAWRASGDRAFDLAYLLEKYGINDVVLLDESPIESLDSFQRGAQQVLESDG